MEIRIPTPAAGTASAYKKLERRAGDFATVGVAVQLHLGADGRIDQAGIGLTAVAETPFAATDAEAEPRRRDPRRGGVRRGSRGRRGAEPARRRTATDRSTTSEPWWPR